MTFYADSDWNDAIAEARKELGYEPDEYVENWEELVELTKEILRS